MTELTCKKFFLEECAAFLTVVLPWVAFVYLIIYPVKNVEAHGRLMDPPARNSAWRFGFPNPVDYNDNELFCGGRTVHWQSNEGKCGLCGDAWHLPVPRPHEDGGPYGNGIIVKRYTAGQDIDVEVELTANHMGKFEFKMCPYNGDVDKFTQDCLDSYPLYVVDSNGDLQYDFQITETRSHEHKSDVYNLVVRLPMYVSCTHCVIQWTYTAGNGWGTCENGTVATGCGPQETFVNCADVAITTNTGTGFGPSGVNKMKPSLHATKAEGYKSNPYLLYYRDSSKKDLTMVPLIIRSQVCLGTGLYRDIKGMENWCQKNCLRYPPSCPPDKCHCLSDCEALPPFNTTENADQYCLDKCLVYPSKCPVDKCRCT